MHDNRTGSTLVRLVDLPSKVQNGLGVRRNAILRPGEKVKLGDGSSFARFEVLQVEAAHQVVVTPDVLRDEVHLVVLVGLAALFRPVPVTQVQAVLSEASQHDDDHTARLPDHLPEVRFGVGQRPLCYDVRRIARVVVGLSSVRAGYKMCTKVEY